MRLAWRTCFVCVLVGGVAGPAVAQPPPTTLTWSEIRDRFRTTNPTLEAGQIGIDESKASEITAFLRPNPLWSLTLDQVGNTDEGNAFSASNLSTAFSY